MGEGDGGGAAAADPLPGAATLTVIGTGHVFAIADAVEGALRALRPVAVFVEVDPQRLQIMLDRRAGHAPQRGKAPFLHRRLEQFQQDMAGLYGVKPGEEILAAVLTGRDIGARVHLIDAAVDQVLRRILKEISWRERLRALGLLAKGALRSVLPGRRRRGREEVDAELRRYEEDPAAAMAELKSTFPRSTAS